MINKNQVCSLMSMFAPKLPVLNNFGEMPHIWNCETLSDEDCQTCPGMANSGILWPAMLTYDPLWLETSCLANSITVSAVSSTSVTVCYIWRFGAFWDKIGEIWPVDATNGPITYLEPSMTNFGQICPIMACSADDWNDSSDFAIRGAIC